MKQLFAVAALILALTPLAQARTEALAGHPEARNDRAALIVTNHPHARHLHHVRHHHVLHHRHHANRPL